MSIITGPNGFGKSTIIKSIKALGESNLLFFYDLKFDKFILENTDINSKIEIVKKDEILEINGDIINEDVISYARRIQLRRMDKGNDESSDLYQKII